MVKFVGFSLAVAAFAALSLSIAAEARLFQVPISGGVQPRRGLEVGSDIDLDNLYQARGVQYADLKVGCPAQSQSAIISTASRAIGFPCSGCDNDCGEGSHLNGLYHEKKSTCYSKVACGDCLLSSASCSAYQCPVGMSYMEGSSWSGVEVEDMVSLGGEDADEEAFPLRFGCQDDITGLFEGQIPDGIFGMNKEKGSAISQWSNLGYLEAAAFSLCYNVREDVKEQSGVMMLGGSDERLHEKPMVFARDVGEKNYELSIKEVRMERGSALSTSIGVDTVASLGLDGTDTGVLDSGTTCTYLPREWQEPLKEAWRQMTGGKYSMFSHLSITDQELNELPTIIFEVEGMKDNETVSISYPPIRYMEKSDYGTGWDFCMYATDSSVTLGNTFMAGHDVLHDLDNKRIGFAESTCQPSIVQLSVEVDAGKKRTLPPMSITSDAPPQVSNLKPMVLQSEPIHKRQRVDPTSPGMDVLYALLALVVVILVVVVLLRRYRDKTVSWWSEPSTKHAYQLSWISLVLTGLAIIAGIVLFSSTGSSLFLVLALENCVDFLSSAVVLWRFFAPSDVTEKLEVELKSREERASRAINMILVILGVGIWITAIQDLLRGQEETSRQQQKTALVVSFFSLVIFGILTAVKFRYAKILDSPSLYKDGICSMIGTILSASLFIDTLIIKGTASAWWIDPVVAIGCGFVSFGYGAQALYNKAKLEVEEDTQPGQKSMSETEAQDEHHIFT